MTWAIQMILWTIGFGVFVYLVTRVLFGWYNLGCYLIPLTEIASTKEKQ